MQWVYTKIELTYFGQNWDRVCFYIYQKIVWYATQYRYEAFLI